MAKRSLGEKIRDRIGLDPVTRRMTARLWGQYMAEQKWWIIFAAFWMVVVASTSAGIVGLVEPTLDRAFAQKSEYWVWACAIGFLSLSILRGIGNFLQSVTMQMVGLRVIMKVQNQMFSAFQRIEVQYLEEHGAARQLSRFTTDCYFLRDAVTKVFTGAGRDTATLIFMIGMMFYQNWQLAIFSMIFFPISVLPIARIGRRLRKVSEATQAEFAELTSVVNDSLTNARSVRAYNMQAYEEERGDDAFVKTYKLLLKSIRTRALSYPIMETLAGFTLFTIIVLGGMQILRGEQTVGSFMAFFMAVFMAYQPMRSLAGLNNTLQEGLAAAKRSFDIIDYDPKIQDAPNAKALEKKDGRVTLEGVHFTYDGEAAVLNGVNIDIDPGETVALVGPSGAGKTTVLNLIPRFYDTTEGSVLIDGQDIKKVTLESVAAQIALVSQEPALFNDTIRSNIAYGRFGASEAEIEQAAKDAAAHDFITGLPDGYDTMVGEQGLKLSGGQRQRIAIARAMLKQAPILLLDEATSALDAESERKVQAALQKLMVGRTTIVIAHRLSTIRKADRIFVMEQGKVVEVGPHDQLVQQDGLYSRLCRIQFQDHDLDAQPAPTPIVSDKE